MRYCFFIALFVSVGCANTFQGYDTVRVREKLGADSAYGIMDSLSVRALKATTVTVGSVDSARASHVSDTAGKAHFADTASKAKPTSAASGGLSGSYPSPSVVGMSSGIADTAKKSNPTSAAGGALGGSYPNPTVDGMTSGIADTAITSDRARKLTTARTIGKTSFDGTANIIPDTSRVCKFADSSANTHKSDTAVSSKQATQLTTARTIGLVSFNGTANIIPDTTKSSKYATQLQTARVIGKSTTFDGTANIVPDSAVSVKQATQLTTARTIGGQSFNGTANIVPDTCLGAKNLTGGLSQPDSFNCHNTIITKTGNISLNKSGVSATAPTIGINGYQNSTGSHSYITMAASNSNILGTLSETSNGTIIGVYDFSGVNSSNAQANVARIFFSQDGVAGATYVPGRMTLLFASASADPVECFRFNAIGLGIGTTVPVEKLTIKGNFVDSGNVRITGNLYLGSSTSALSTYIDTTFKDSLFDGTTYRTYTASARIVQIGSIVNLYQPALTGTISAGTVTYIKGIPAKFFPSTTPKIPVQINNSGTYDIGVAYFDGSVIEIQTSANGLLSTGTGGIAESVINITK
jgi:hypothetical protein